MVAALLHLEDHRAFLIGIDNLRDPLVQNTEGGRQVIRPTGALSSRCWGAGVWRLRWSSHTAWPPWQTRIRWRHLRFCRLSEDRWGALWSSAKVERDGRSWSSPRDCRECLASSAANSEILLRTRRLVDLLSLLVHQQNEPVERAPEVNLLRCPLLLQSFCVGRETGAQLALEVGTLLVGSREGCWLVAREGLLERRHCLGDAVRPQDPLDGVEARDPFAVEEIVVFPVGRAQLIVVPGVERAVQLGIRCAIAPSMCS